MSDKDKTQFLFENINIKVGSYAAVAYSDCWYPGQIIAEEWDLLTVKFLHPSKVNDNVFRWPQTDDCSEVEKSSSSIQIVKSYQLTRVVELGIWQVIQMWKGVMNTPGTVIFIHCSIFCVVNNRKMNTFDKENN